MCPLPLHPAIPFNTPPPAPRPGRLCCYGTQKLIVFLRRGLDRGRGAWYTPGMNTTNPIDPDDLASDADRRAFTDAAAHMSQEDWDADNDWLASAGWGEM